MKKYNLWNTLVGWVVFAIAAATYLLTIEPTASFWDCGEFIACADKLDVGHPPGAPFFMLMGHFFSLFASDPSYIAMCINAMSALASAFTILFLFWTITALGRKLIAPDTVAKGIALLGAGAVGALAYTFSDTFWFSAVEGEVYASSSMFTALVVWLMLKWDDHADEEGSDKWLILIAYLMGLSIGVHLLNLLTIPALVLIYYFRRYDFTWRGAIRSLVISVAILAAVLYGIIPGIPTIAGWFELLFTNTFGAPFNTGVAIYITLMFCALIWGLYETYRVLDGKNELNTRTIIAFVSAMAFAGIPFLMSKAWIGIALIALMLGLLIWKKTSVDARWLNTATWMVTMIVVGYSCFTVLVIRSAADPSMDENSPDNVFSLKYYLNRDQYGDTPLLYGQVYNAPVKLDIDNNRGICTPRMKLTPQYGPDLANTDKDRYAVVGQKPDYEYMDEFQMPFSRLWSAQAHHVAAYKEWADIKGKRFSYDYCGRRETAVIPTFGENLRFFFRYQVHFMYWRYFMWNFAGRQNDMQSTGELQHGNWISGIPFIDNAMLGDQSKLPAELRENKGHNVYYMLPLLLGIIGMCWQVGKRSKKGQHTGAQSFAITMLLFLLTGLAIVLYLNQTPIQPRERDYAYAGSFYAFTIWIGLAVMALFDWVTEKMKSEPARIAVASALTLVCLAVPAQMASQNWDDHDRSNRTACRDFGANYLNSCEEDGIIFTNGDNDTFPLWYCQEVESIGDDKRVCNLSYLQTGWYIDQMRRPYFHSSALPISWQPKDYMTEMTDVVYVRKDLGEAEAGDAFRYMLARLPKTREDAAQLPSDHLYVLTPDSQKIAFRIKNRYLRSEMMIMEMMSQNSKQDWKRPMYFAVSVGSDYYLGLEPYFELTGLAYRVTTERSQDGQPRVNTEIMYDNMMHKFRYGGMDIPGIYIDENLMRMCRTHRMMFVELARALYMEHKDTMVLEVLDYAEKVLPGYNIPYDGTSSSMASLYYALGEFDKGNAIMDAVANTCVEYLEWGASLNRNQRKRVDSTINYYGRLLASVLQQANQAHQQEILDKYVPIFNRYAN